MKLGNTIIKASTVAFVLTTIIMMNACKKDSNSSSSTANNTSASTLTANGASADNAYDDAFNVAVQTSNDNNLNSMMAQKAGGVTTNSVGATTTNGSGYYCAAVSVSGSTFPVTVTVDFGAGCTSTDHVVRSGSITYVFTGKLSTPGTVISATFNNYIVNGYKLGGTYSITNSTIGNTLSITTAVANGSITYPNDSSYSFSGTKTSTLVSGDASDLTTWVLNVTGGYSISNANGENLTVAVTTPLVRKLSCPYIVSGVAGFTYTKGSVSVAGTLDYGTGNCDASAVITIGAFTKAITLN